MLYPLTTKPSSNMYSHSNQRIYRQYNQCICTRALHTIAHLCTPTPSVCTCNRRLHVHVCTCARVHGCEHEHPLGAKRVLCTGYTYKVVNAYTILQKSPKRARFLLSINFPKHYILRANYGDNIG